MSSLFRKGEGWSVFTIEAKKAQIRNLNIGNKNSTEAEVLNGIAPGTEVILLPSNKLEHGIPVTMLR